MTHRAQVQLLSDQRRLHLQDGPIDIILEAFGPLSEIAAAYHAAMRRFATVLDELCSELSLLRQPFHADAPKPTGLVAQRMARAVAPYAARTFITPMAAVAGAVAEEILEAMISSADLDRAYVNDGGDIAIHLLPGQQFIVGMVERPDRPSLFGSAALDADQPARGIATSGWRGRSFSLGIADAVTVLADGSAMADAAATIIANAVDLASHPNITRMRACDLAPDSDLGERLVTQNVGDLTISEISQALDAGTAAAHSLLSAGLIRAAALCLRRQARVIGEPSGKLKITDTHGSLVNA